MFRVIVFILNTVFISIACSGLLIFVIDKTLKSNGLGFVQVNLWDFSLMFYATLIFFPLSFILQKYLKQIKKLPVYLIWFVFPLLYVCFYLLSLYLGVVYQLSVMGISKEQGLMDYPVTVNMNFILLSYFLVTSIVLAVISEVIWVKLLLKKLR